MTLADVPLLIRERPCLVVGSAPRSGPLDIPPDTYVITINGAIGQVEHGRTDLWLVNARSYSQSTWSPERLFLHNTMVQQAAGRHVPVIGFLMRDDTAIAVMTERLTQINCTFEGHLPIFRKDRKQIESQMQGRGPRLHPLPLSAGFFGVALALWAGAPHVQLEGFSFEPGYAYLPQDRVPAYARGHVNPDKEALTRTLQLYPERLTGPIIDVCLAHPAPVSRLRRGRN